MAEPTPLQVDETAAALLNKALKLQDFFPEFSAEHAVKLFPRSGMFLFPVGSQLLRQGEPGRDLFVLLSGKLEVLQDKAGAMTRLGFIDPGAVVGEIALLSKLPRTATVAAMEESRAYKLVESDLQYILTHNEELAAHLKQLAAQRLGL
jgi:CRP-like cAMP-binding protein